MQLYCIDLKDAIYFAAVGIAISKVVGFLSSVIFFVAKQSLLIR